MGIGRRCLPILASLLAACGGSDALQGPPAPGMFDKSFGTQGIAVIEPAADSRSYAVTAAVDAKGRIVVAGSDVPLGYGDKVYRSLFARFTPAGVLDPSWGDGGIFRPPENPATSREGVFVAMLDGDRMLLGEKQLCRPAGQSPCGTRSYEANLLAQRHGQDGGIDATYGESGTASIAVNDPSIVSFGGGSLATFGYGYVPAGDPRSKPVLQVRRIDERGQLDEAYSSAAEAALKGAFGGEYLGRIMTLSAGGGRVLAAAAVNGRVVLVRLAADGSPDRSYGTLGVVDPAARGVDRLPVGSVRFLVGRPLGGVAIVYELFSPVPIAGRLGAGVAWIGPDGALESRSGAGNESRIDPALVGSVEAVVSQGNERLLVAGYPLFIKLPNPGNQPDYDHPRVASIDTSGMADFSFGEPGLGYVPLESGGRTIGPRHMLRGEDGSLYIVGTVPPDSLPPTRTVFALAKLGS